MKQKVVLFGLVVLAATATASVDADSGWPSRGWLGVTTDNLEEPVLIALGVEQGVIVSRVVDSGPAAAAGLQVGDVIVDLDSEPIGDASDLRRAVRTKPDRSVDLLVLRKAQRRHVTVRLASRHLADFGPFDDPGFFEPLQDVLGWVGPELGREVECFGGSLDSLRRDIQKLRQEMQELREQLRQERHRD